MHLRNIYCGIVFMLLLSVFSRQTAIAQAPSNDSCTRSEEIVIPSGGFGLGVFQSSEINITQATLESGEQFAPAIFVAGLDKKSVWLRFRLPTIRAVRVTLTQPGTAITAGDVGFAVYYTSGCLPGTAQISTQLTPIVTFGNTYHPCVPAGDYLVQVSGKQAVNGPIRVELEISDQTGAAYDHPDEAYSFGTANVYSRFVDFDAECHSIEDQQESCTALFNAADYHKSAWFTFTTPAYFDYITLALSGTGTPQYFSTGSGVQRKFGFNLYRGNAMTDPYNSLSLVQGCDSLLTNGYRPALKQFLCSDLTPGTTYSIQLFFHKDFKENLRLAILTGGTGPTAGPLPVNTLPASNQLGLLNPAPAGASYTFSDRFGCNSRHTDLPCAPAKPAGGVTVGNTLYTLSSFAAFRLDRAAAITFQPGSVGCGPRPVIRLFRHTLTGNCADLDTSDLIGTASFNQEIECLQPGDYVMQVLGVSTPVGINGYTAASIANNSNQCLYSNLGTPFSVLMRVFTRQASNRYALQQTGAFDSINRSGNLQLPLQNGISYTGSPDTIGCQPTLRPFDTTCSPLNDKVIYRQLVIGDSGILTFTGLTYSNNPPLRYRLYEGDANALAAAQQVFQFPDRVSGIVPNTLCFNGALYCENKSTCVTPGTYTFTTMGSVGDVGRVDRPVFTFNRTRTRFNSPLNAQDMGSIMDTLGPNGGTRRSIIDYWSCEDNAVPINGYQPCTIGGRPAVKAIYRQFYLKENTQVRIFNTSFGGWCADMAFGTKTLFYGKATDGLSGLTPVGGQWNCFSSASTGNNCSFLPAGWYTVVSYGTGPNYDSTTRLTNTGGKYNGYVSYRDEFSITITPACQGPVYNRPHKASVAAGGQAHLIQWGFRAISTPVNPRTDTTFVLPTERFNCVVDTPFSNHPVNSCFAGANRVAYYVFRTTQVSFLQINLGGYTGAVFNLDVRSDSAMLTSATPIQQCINRAGYIQFCELPAGTYTLVVFASDANICSSVTPRIFIDRVGYSRFDYAANAYDFGAVPPDNTFYTGKVGDVNPLNPLRGASNDFIHCTTGAFNTDPSNQSCNTAVHPYVYGTAAGKSLYDSAYPAGTSIARRNLWYSFVVSDPGTVRVRVLNQTSGRGLQPKFGVYRSDVDPSLPFSTVVANGLADSTIAQGLSFVTHNAVVYYPGYCYNTNNTISFYRDPCSATPTRYYIIVENVNGWPAEPGGQLPITQIEVAVSVDSVNLVLPRHDHYYNAGDFGTVGAGTYTGDQDNYSCATRRGPDPVFNTYGTCTKTLWYKFTSTITGNVRFRIRVNGTVTNSVDQVQLLREVIPGDSTTTGLKYQAAATVGSPSGNWGQTCVAPGVYYLLLTGCNRVNEYVTPEIELIEQEGDFCSRAAPAVLNGAGSVSASLLVNCHTIGTDYGEFGPALTCPPNATTGAYKSSWFRIEIGGTDTLDVTTYLVENTNASSSDIKYRLMTGDCNAMQEQSCVFDALTQNTYQCMVPGQSYYVQVFTPLLKSNAVVTGTIELRLSAIPHADTCAPVNNCLVNANFDTVFNCNTGDSVKFVNFSTFGNQIRYEWDFGYNGQQSNAVSPSFFYPALPGNQSYTVKLKATNLGCNRSDSVEKTFVIPGRPDASLGPDVDVCGSVGPVILRATSWPGATYQWQNNSTADTFRVTAAGNNNYRVRISYNGCSSSDTVRVLISNLSSRPLQTIYICGDSVQVDVRRGNNETYLWSTGATTRAVWFSEPGIYWAEVIHFGICTYRDSFNVVKVQPDQPLGNDTTVCLSNGGYTIHAAIPGAVSYTWQNNSRADSFRVTSPGQYRVAISFGNCTLRDTVNITGFPPLQQEVTDTSICAGEIFYLPWGAEAVSAGSYSDTLRYGGGCDSLIRRYNISVYPKPDIGPDTTLCFSNGSSLILDATTPGGTGYSWQNGETTAQITVTTPGTYQVQVLFATCYASDTVTVTDFTAPQIRITDTTVCSGGSVLLPWGLTVNQPGTYSDTLAFSNGGCDSLVITYRLSILPGINLGNDTTAEVCSGVVINLDDYFPGTGLIRNWTLNNQPVSNPSAVSSGGSYQLIAQLPGGCLDTALLVLTVNPRPALGNDTLLNRCGPLQVNLLSIYPTGGLTSNWTTGGVPVMNPSAVTVGGLYQLTVSNSSGCRDTANLQLNVFNTPALGNDTSLFACSGTTVDLSSLFNITGLTVRWTLNNQPVPDSAAVQQTGRYVLVATNSNGCSDTAQVDVLFHPRPQAGNDTTLRLCGQQSYNLVLLEAGGSLVTDWFFAGQPVSNPSAVAASGLYQQVISNTQGCSDTAAVNLLFLTSPVLGADQNLSICAGSTADLTSLYNTGGLPGNWTQNGDIIATPGSISQPGLYQLLVTDNNGCSDSALVTVTVNPLPWAGRDTIVHRCAGNSLNLESVFQYTGTTGSWFTAGQPVGNPAAITAAGLYERSVLSPKGCRDTARLELILNPVPVLGQDRQIRVCPGTATDLNALYITGGFQANWTLNSLPVANTAAVFTGGTYQLIASGSTGCSDTALVTISYHPVPDAGRDTALQVCPGLPVNLLQLNPAPGQWSFSGTVVTDPGNVLNSGIFQLEMMNAEGCRDTALANITRLNAIQLGADQTIRFCSDSSVNLNSLFPGSAGNQNAWSSGGQPFLQPANATAAGLYTLISTNTGSCSDTANVLLVSLSAPVLLVNNPAPLCIPQTTDLTATSVTAGSEPGLQFSYWTDSLASQPLDNPAAAKAGRYFIRAVTAEGCVSIRPVDIREYPLPVVNAGPDKALCNSDSTTLLQVAVSGQTGNAIIRWEPVQAGGIADPGSASTQVQPTAVPVIYSVTVTDESGCGYTIKDSVRLTRQPPVQAVAGNDTIAVAGLPHQLSASGGVRYLWTPAGPLNNPGIPDPLAVIQQDSVRFTVTVWDQFDCSGTATILVKTYAGITYYVPSAFSPNGDGLNDVFRPVPVGIISTDLFRVFNRYGELVFETNQWMKGWDGTYRGRAQPVGNYVWMIRGRGRNGKVIEMKGNVVLVR